MINWNFRFLLLINLAQRAIFFVIFSVYDPCFLISPAIVNAKKLFQEICSLGLSWDYRCLNIWSHFLLGSLMFS